MNFPSMFSGSKDRSFPENIDHPKPFFRYFRVPADSPYEGIDIPDEGIEVLLE